MWFKQVQHFNLSSPLKYEPEALADQLAEFILTPCLPSLPQSLGWVSPFEHSPSGPVSRQSFGNKEGNSQIQPNLVGTPPSPASHSKPPPRSNAPLVFAVDGYILISLGIAEKVLPATVVRQGVQDKIKAIEAKDQRRVGQRQRQAIKDEVIQTLLPRAFVKFQKLFACIDTRNQWLWLATTSSRYTEFFMLGWQKVLPTIGLVRPELRKVGSILSHWVTHHRQPKAFVIEKNAVLQDVRQQNRVIRCQQQDLFAPSILSLLKDGCEVRQLALRWQDRVHFTIDDALQLRSLRFSDELVERQADPLSESPEMRLLSDFTILTANLTELYTDLFACFVKAEEQQAFAI